MNYIDLYFLQKYLNLTTTIFIILRKKQNQLSTFHFYHNFNELLIIFLIYSDFYEFVYEFMTLSVISSLLKYIYYLLYSYSHVSVLYKFLRSYRVVLNHLHYLMMSCVILFSFKYFVCYEKLIFIAHIIDLIVVITLKNTLIKMPRLL